MNIDYIVYFVLLLLLSCKPSNFEISIDESNEIVVTLPKSYVGHRSLSKYQNINNSDCLCLMDREQSSLVCLNIYSSEIEAEFTFDFGPLSNIRAIVDYEVLNDSELLVIDATAYSIVDKQGKSLNEFNINKEVSSSGGVSAQDKIYYPYSIVQSNTMNINKNDSLIIYNVLSSKFVSDSITFVLANYMTNAINRQSFYAPNRMNEYSFLSSIPNLFLPLTTFSDSLIYYNFSYNNELHVASIESKRSIMKELKFDVSSKYPPNADEFYQSIDSQPLLSSVTVSNEHNKIFIIRNLFSGNNIDSPNTLFVVDKNTLVLQSEMLWPQPYLTNVFLMEGSVYAMRFDDEIESNIVLNEIKLYD